MRDGLATQVDGCSRRTVIKKPTLKRTFLRFLLIDAAVDQVSKPVGNETEYQSRHGWEQMVNPFPFQEAEEEETAGWTILRDDSPSHGIFSNSRYETVLHRLTVEQKDR